MIIIELLLLNMINYYWIWLIYIIYVILLDNYTSKKIRDLEK